MKQPQPFWLRDARILSALSQELGRQISRTPHRSVWGFLPRPLQKYIELKALAATQGLKLSTPESKRRAFLLIREILCTVVADSYSAPPRAQERSIGGVTEYCLAAWGARVIQMDIPRWGSPRLIHLAPLLAVILLLLFPQPKREQKQGGLGLGTSPPPLIRLVSTTVILSNAPNAA